MMTVYLDLVILLNFLVDWLLLLGTNRLCGYPPDLGRTVLAAGLGSVYAGGCLLPEFTFLGNWFWRAVSLLLISVVAFGFSVSALRRGIVFVLLSMALGGIATGFGNGGFWQLLFAAVGVFLMCWVGFRGRLEAAAYVPVEITFAGNKLHLMALKDTGNSLRDPVTGRPVLVIGAEAAQKLTGLTPHQLRDPLQAIGSLPGSRLIPYHTIGQPCGMLLALRINDVKIGEKKESVLVAFAPDSLSREGAYQALTGGVA